MYGRNGDVSITSLRNILSINISFIMKKIGFINFLLLFCFANIISAQEFTTDARDVCPLLPGEKVPEATVKSITGEEVELTELLEKQLTVMIFYRGSWCPYCNKHLSKIQGIEASLKDMGFQILAVSPDLPENLEEAVSKSDLSYTLLSDATMAFTKKMGLAFELDEKTRKKYKLFGINLEKASGETHHLLPVPALLLINKKGEIEFSYVNPLYKKRLSPDVVLAAAKSMLEE